MKPHIKRGAFMGWSGWTVVPHRNANPKDYYPYIGMGDSIRQAWNDWHIFRSRA